MTLATLTPKQAADRAKVSRGTIMNAIKDGSLTGFRDNRNHWQIHPDKLSEWMAGRGVTATDIDPDNSVKPDTPKSDENALRIAVLEVELNAEKKRSADLESDRDSWKEQAQQLARRPRRWWPF